MPKPFLKKPFARAAIGAGVLLALGIVWTLSLKEVLSSASPVEGGGVASRSISPLAPKRDRPPLPRPSRSFAEILAGAQDPEMKALSEEQIENFVNSRNRDADSLLAAFRLGGDMVYLKEALEKFPDYPPAILASLPWDRDPEKRLAALEHLNRLDPDNALGNCLAAGALLKLGRRDEAFAELQKSSGKTLDDFMLSSVQNNEEALLASGVSSAQAKLMAFCGLNKPLVLELRNLADALEQMRGSYQGEGDTQSVGTLRQIQVDVARQLQDSGCLVDILVGSVIERKALESEGSEESEARLADLKQYTQSLTASAHQIEALMKDPAVPEADWQYYFDRLKLFGEKAANEWMLGQHPQP